MPLQRFLASAAFLAAALLAASGFAAEKSLSLTLQSRAPSGAKQSVREQWLPQHSAIIVCDMWDLHHCKNAVTREGEMAPRMNAVIEKARNEGVLIIHAPSSCMKPYEGAPARERAKSAPQANRLPDKIAEWCKQIPAEEMTVYPIDQTDGGEDDDPAEHAAWAKELEAKGLNPRAPWTKQIDVLRIDQEKDAISDSGVEIWNLLEARGIQNVILMGVHVNMCVAGRPFGLRQLAKNGKHVTLMRDMTDAMYNPQRWPFVSHQRGTELFIEHVESRICPTITSDQILGGQPFAFSKATAGAKRLQILLLGDSSTEAIIPKKVAPKEPQFEDVIRMLLASGKDMPPADVINEGGSGETIRRLIDSGRYDKSAAKLTGLDYIFIRYGLNDHSKREDFENNFPKDFHELLARLRKDHPAAMLIPMTVMPWADEAMCMKINGLIRTVATEEKLALFDIYPRYDAELKRGPDMLNYRRYALAKIPENLRAFATPYVTPGKDPAVVVLDNHLDGIFGHLPGWFSDRHPNLAGYNIIADETVKFLAPIIRARQSLAK